MSNLTAEDKFKLKNQIGSHLICRNLPDNSSIFLIKHDFDYFFMYVIGVPDTFITYKTISTNKKLEDESWAFQKLLSVLDDDLNFGEGEISQICTKIGV